MADLSERSKLPLRWAVAIAGAAIAFSAAAAVARSDLARHDKSIEEMQAEQREADRRIQRLEDNYKNIREGIDEIKREVKK